MRLNHGNAGLRVCIDKIENGQVHGWVLGQRLEEPMLFEDLGNLILQIDELLDRQDFPRAFQRRRSFAPAQPTGRMPQELTGSFMEAQMVAQGKGKLVTLEVSIISRQNTSWQGTIDWLDGSKQQGFRSALEFVRHINDRLVTGV